MRCFWEILMPIPCHFISLTLQHIVLYFMCHSCISCTQLSAASVYRQISFVSILPLVLTNLVTRYLCALKCQSQTTSLGADVVFFMNFDENRNRQTKIHNLPNDFRYVVSEIILSRFWKIKSFSFQPFLSLFVFNWNRLFAAGNSCDDIESSDGEQNVFSVKQKSQNKTPLSIIVLLHFSCKRSTFRLHRIKTKRKNIVFLLVLKFFVFVFIFHSLCLCTIQLIFFVYLFHFNCLQLSNCIARAGIDFVRNKRI